MELTDTNEPCGLTISFFKQSFCPAINCHCYFFGGHSEEVPPVPIPNTEVKLFSADGTAWETMWESRSPPIFYPKPLVQLSCSKGFFYVEEWLLTSFTSIFLKAAKKGMRDWRAVTSGAPITTLLTSAQARSVNQAGQIDRMRHSTWDRPTPPATLESWFQALSHS